VSRRKGKAEAIHAWHEHTPVKPLDLRGCPIKHIVLGELSHHNHAIPIARIITVIESHALHLRAVIERVYHG
jgi:hypothetical protein